MPPPPSKEIRTFEEDAAELQHERVRLIVAGGLPVTSLVVMAAGQWLDLVAIPSMPCILLTLALTTMFATGWFIKKMAWASLRRGIFNQHVLLELTAFAGIAGGLLGIFVLDGFPTRDFFAAATLVTTCHILSHYASLPVRTRASKAARRLMALRPDTARVIRDGQKTEIPINQVALSNLVRIRPGESIPVDGVVVDGVSAVNEALVTGEPIPLLPRYLRRTSSSSSQPLRNRWACRQPSCLPSQQIGDRHPSLGRLTDQRRIDILVDVANLRRTWLRPDATFHTRVRGDPGWRPGGRSVTRRWGGPSP